MKRFLLPLILSTSWLQTGTAEVHELTPELADRYEVMLLQSPQPGKAFDQLVEWYSTKGGGLEALQKRWEAAHREKPENRQAYGIAAGMLAQRLHQPDEARRWYGEAIGEKGGHAHLAARLLAELETTEGNFPEAAKAYELALGSSELPPMDRLDFIRSLALLHSRTFEEDKALALWHEAIRQSPEDPQVLEEAGEAFLAAGRFDDARATFEALRKASERDPYRKVAAVILLARTEDQEGKTAKAAEIYLKALDETSAGSWLARDIRSRIDEMYRRKEDLPGLQALYEARIAAAPQDHQTYLALSRVQRDLNHGDQALVSLRKATELAPGDVALRLSLIRLLAEMNRHDEALEEAELLARPADASQEVLLLLGDLQWQAIRNRPELREAAYATWRRLAPEASRDIARLSLLADLLYRHEAQEEAVTVWQRLLTIDPSAVDARQRIAAFHLEKGDKAAARRILTDLIALPGAGAEAFLALVRAQTAMKWQTEADATLQDALKRFPEDEALVQFAWRRAQEEGSLAAAERLLPQVWKLAPSLFYAEEAAARFARLLAVDEAAAKRWETDPGESALHATVRLQLAIFRNDRAAAQKARAALQTSEEPLRGARAGVLFAQAFGTPQEQIAALEALGEADPKQLTASLRTVVQVLVNDGRPKVALDTLDQLISRTPADPSLYLQYADIALQDAAYEKAVQRLNSALRYVEDATPIRMQLATVARQQGQVEEAARLLQEAFEKETRASQRNEIFRRQVEVATSLNRLEELIASLRERQAKEKGGARYGGYLAEIYMMQGDLLTAREELARSLGQNPDDPQALRQLINLSNRGGDLTEGLRLSRRLVDVEPTAENRAQYLSRLMMAGEEAEVAALLAEARESMVKDPAPWQSVLAELRYTRFRETADAIISESIAAQTGIVGHGNAARFALVQGRFEDAEKMLWEVFEESDAASALKEIDRQTRGVEMGTGVAMVAPLHMINQEIQQFFMELGTAQHGQSFLRGAYRNYSSSKSFPPEQAAAFHSLMTLQYLMLRDQRLPEFYEKLEAAAERKRLGALERLELYKALGHREGLERLVRKIAASDTVDPDLARAVLRARTLPITETAALLEQLEKEDPAAAIPYVRQAAFDELGRIGGSTSKEKKRAALQHLYDLSEGRKQPLSAVYIDAMTAASYGETELALAFLERARNAATGSSQADRRAAMMTIPQAEAVVARHLIVSGHPKAEENLLRWFGEISKNGTPPMGFYGRSEFQLPTGGTPAFGGKAFPYADFQSFRNAGRGNTTEVLGWLAERREKDRRIALLEIYLLLEAQEPAQALAAAEKLQAAHPTPEGETFLAEMYEVCGQSEKALAMLEKNPPLAPKESMIMRELRRIRLLRQLKRPDEARPLAEALVRKRIPMSLIPLVQVECSPLGVAIAQRGNLPMRQHFGAGMEIARQIDQLVKTDPEAAIRIGLNVLRQPFPARSNYQQINLRQQAAQTLARHKLLENYLSELNERLVKSPGDLVAVASLLELSAYRMREDQSALEPIRAALSAALKSDRSIRDLTEVLHVLAMYGSRSEILSGLIVQIVNVRPELIVSGEVDLGQLVQQLNQSPGKEKLAETLAGLDEAGFRRLTRRYRLRPWGSFVNEIGIMANWAFTEGKPEVGITLLERAQPMLSENPPMLLLLVEKQLAVGRKEAAARTLLSFLQPEAAGAASGWRGSTPAQILSMMMQQGGNQSEQLERFAKVAMDAGVLDEVIAQLEKDKVVFSGLPLVLILKTYGRKPGFEEEWAKYLDSPDSTKLTMLPPAALSSILRVLNARSDGKKRTLKLIDSVDATSLSRSGPYTLLPYFSEVVPLLGKYSDEPVVIRHLNQLINGFSGQQGSQLVHYPGFSAALEELMENSFTDQAQQLCELAMAQSGNGYGGLRQLEQIATRIRQQQEDTESYSITAAAFPEGKDRLRVYWKANSAPVSLRRQRRGDVAQGWEQRAVKLRKERYPREIGIYAGREITEMRKVGEIRRPTSLSGSTEITISAPVGLVQARWKDADGKQRSGPLSLYVTGENLLDGKEGMIEEAAGPVGRSAVLMPSEGMNQPKIRSLATVPMNDDYVIAFTGWLRGEGLYGNSVQFQITEEWQNGKEQIQSHSDQVLPGQWRPFVYFWARNSDGDSVRQVNKEVNALRFAIQIYDQGGASKRNLLDGVQITRIPKSALVREEVPQAAYLEALRAKDYAKAAKQFVEQARLHPDSIGKHQQWIEIVEGGGAAGDEVFAFLCQSTLYEKNPLRSFERVLQSRQTLEQLARIAVAPNARPAARKWLDFALEQSLEAGTQSYMRLLLLKEEAREAPEKITAARLLNTLGWNVDEANTDLLQTVWQSDLVSPLDQSGIFEWIALARRTGKAAKLREIIRKSPLSTEAPSGRSLLLAFLLLPEHPQEAMKAWQEDIRLRSQPQSNSYVQPRVDEAFLVEMARTDFPPRELLGQIRVWMEVKTGWGRKSSIAEILRACASEASPHREEYRDLWAEEESKALKQSDYAGTAGDVRELLRYYQDREQWQALDELFAAIGNTKAFTDNTLRRELEQIKAQRDFAHGEIGNAWPAVWYDLPSAQTPQEVTLRWQWIIRNVRENRSAVDAAVIIPPQPMAERLETQVAIEFFFGELPNEMKPIARIEGQATLGSQSIRLPSANGFLRAEAVLNDRRITGPLVPYLTGKRVFPAPDESLRTMLTRGKKAFTDDLLYDGGTAPDGSPAIIIGKESERDGDLSFYGVRYAAQPSRFYVNRGWIRRVGKGRISAATLYRNASNPKANELNMVLTSGQESTHQWTYFTRAVPSLPQHTFWIPYQEVQDVTPHLWTMSPGTGIAGWELLEIEGWKYGEWISELARLRAGGEAVAPEKVYELASIEPLTALDYHGQWIVDQLGNTPTLAERLPALFRTALEAEPNPLFGKPKFGRVFGALAHFIRKESVPIAAREEALALAFANETRYAPAQYAGYLEAMLALKPEGQNRQAVIDLLRARMDSPEKLQGFLPRMITAHQYTNGQPANPFFRLCTALKDDGINRDIYKVLKDGKLKAIPSYERHFAALAFGMLSGEAQEGAAWDKAVKLGFLESERENDLRLVMFWPTLLASEQATRDPGAESLYTLRRQGLERLRMQTERHRNLLPEIVRASDGVIASALARKEIDVMKVTAGELAERLNASKDAVDEPTRRLVQGIIDTLKANACEAEAAKLEASAPLGGEKL